MAQFYKDKAVASNSYDTAVGAADEAGAKTLIPDFANWYVELNTGVPITENLAADIASVTASESSAVEAAQLSEIGGYGDAEITEAQTIGKAEIDLATAQGGDEVSLANEESAVADTLQSEKAAADETLGAALAGDGETDSETAAGDESNTTSIEGGDEIATQTQLAAEEATTAMNLAGAQADYAIALAQVASAAASAFAQANPGDGQAQFDLLYAQGYVTWLTDLKPAFVADATGVAQAAGQKEIALVSADVNLADQEAADNANFVTTEAPQSAQESDTTQTEGVAYQTSTVTNVGQDQVDSAIADQTQMIDLAGAGSAHIVAGAQADKAMAVNAATNVSGWQTTYTKDPADATAWQTMSDGEATTSDQFAHQDDGDQQSQNDAVAANESDALTAEAQADQTQGNSDAAAEANFQIAQANETSTIWSWLASQFPLPSGEGQGEGPPHSPPPRGGGGGGGGRLALGAVAGRAGR